MNSIMLYCVDDQRDDSLTAESSKTTVNHHATFSPWCDTLLGLTIEVVYRRRFARSSM
jgi:hypothetical protein